MMEVRVAWTPDDVLEEAWVCGVEMTKEGAEVLLREVEDDLVNAMLEAGWEVINNAINNALDRVKQGGAHERKTECV